MNDTRCVTIIAVDKENNIVIRPNMPKHPDMDKGYPWLYIDTQGRKYYKVWGNKDRALYLVLET